MQCPKCKQEVSDNSKFCSNCGTNIKEYLEKLENEKYIKCPNCSKNIEKDAKFCKYCGEKILNMGDNNFNDESIGGGLILVIIVTILLLIFIYFSIIFLFSSPKSQISEIEQTTQPTATIEVLNSRLFNMGYGTQKIEGVVKNNSNATCFNPNVEIYTFDSAGNRVGEYPIPIMNALNPSETYKFTIYVNGASRYSVEKCNCGY